ncbi:COG1361 family protein [Nonomuraea africana]|uniref:Repeat protein (TIGR01451 family) n=1 Tax=Nonomuraea africana TaxID=46171 RepID=A0ABR9KU65_9ACTN|nr:DUF11 domain-containing protein [Nonomuraea africana]MBE1565565.1 putative repeat protein (TIGR01451 family) [Nonomuraea africana]
MRVLAGLVGVVVLSGPMAVRADGGGGRADLSVTVSAGPSTAQPGQLISYRVQVRNDGPGDAVLPVLKVNVPAEVDILGVDVATCRPGRTVSEVVCPSDTDVIAGGTGGVTINGIVRPGARGPLRLLATISSAVEDPDPLDNVVTLDTGVAPGADLGVRLRGRPKRGAGLSMAATVRNRGPRPVRDAQVSFTTDGARLLSAEGARCDTSAGQVVCALRRVEAGRKVRFTLAFRAPRRPVKTLAVVRSSQVGDRRPADNQASMRLSVR